MADKVTAQAVKQSVDAYNQDKKLSWSLGTNYTNVGTQFETYVNHYLFPKLQETKVINRQLGNRFNFLAKETPYIGQLSEEYVIMDSVPVDLDLTRETELMLKRNYPRMASRLYNAGVHRKMKFTLNDNENRLNFSTLGDAIKYAVAVYEKKISDINVDEESEIRAMLVDYGLNHINKKCIRHINDIDELASELFKAFLNLQNNSSKYNEASDASGGAIGRYTTQSDIKDLLVLTTDDVKSYILDTKLANTFQVAGLDLTDHVISFDDLGGVYKLNEDVTVLQQDVEYLRAMSDYQTNAGDVIQAGCIFTFDVSQLDSFKGKVTELKPDSKLWALVFDQNAIYYKRNTSKLLPTYFYNNEFDEYTYFMHYYSFKAISPFYNKLLITQAPAE